jgi:hypothetical protein
MYSIVTSAVGHAGHAGRWHLLPPERVPAPSSSAMLNETGNDHPALERGLAHWAADAPHLVDGMTQSLPGVEKAAFRRVLARVEARLEPLQVQFVMASGVRLPIWDSFRVAFNRIFAEEGGTEKGPFLSAEEIRAKDALKQELFANCTAGHCVDDGSLSLTIDGEWLAKLHFDQPSVWKASLDEYALATRNALRPEHRSFKLLFRDKTDAAEVFRSERVNRKLSNRSWDPINLGPGSVLINNDLPVMTVNRSDEYGVLHAHASEDPAYVLWEAEGDVQKNYRGMTGMKVVHFSMIKPFELAGKTSSSAREPRPWTSNAAARRLAHNGIMRGEQVPASFAELEGDANAARVARVSGAIRATWPALRLVITTLHRVRWGQDALPPAAAVPAALAPAAAARGHGHAAAQLFAPEAAAAVPVAARPTADVVKFNEAFCAAHFSGCAEAQGEPWLAPGTIQAICAAAAVASGGVLKEGLYRPTKMDVSAIWAGQGGFEVEGTVERRMFLFAVLDALERTYRAGFLGYVSDYKGAIEALRIKFKHVSNLFFTHVPRAVGHRIGDRGELTTLVIANALMAHRLSEYTRLQGAYKAAFNQDGPPTHLYQYDFEQLFYDIFHEEGTGLKGSVIVPLMMAAAQAGVLPAFIKDLKVFFKL